MPQAPDPTVQNRLGGNRLVIVDTCFAMSPGFEAFVDTYYTDAKRGVLTIPTSVKAELEKLQRSSKQDKKQKAEEGIRVLAKMISAKTARLIGEPGEETKIADEVIQTVLIRLRTSRDIVVLTNDVDLAKDLYQLWDLRAVDTNHIFRIFKINSKTDKVQDFVIDDEPRQAQSFAQPARVYPNQVQPFSIAHKVATVSLSKIPVPGNLNTGDTICLADGSKYTLGKKIGSGGEGLIYEVNNRKEICKLYFGERLTKAAKDKIALLTTRRVNYPGICWPSEAVSDSQGNFRGFLMPKAEGVPLGQSLFLPQPFMKKHPRWTRLQSTRLAITILKQIQFLHDIGVILGDINPQNFLLVDENNVFLVDCDSFQVEGFACPVGTVNFTPPELQGIDFKSQLRTKEHELFAVATLLFMIYFPGNCPYNHTGGTDGASNIKKGEFPYSGEWKKGRAQAPMGVWRYCWGHLAGCLQLLFKSTFDSSEKTPQRPTLQEWLSGLTRYERLLTNPSEVFLGPKPVSWGYDLSIMPQSVWYHRDRGKNNDLPRDGRTGYEKLQVQVLRELKKNPKALPVKPGTISGFWTPSTAPVANTQSQSPHTVPATQTTKPQKQASAATSCGCLLSILLVVGGGIGTYVYHGMTAVTRTLYANEAAFVSASAFVDPDVDLPGYSGHSVRSRKLMNPIVVAAITERTAYAPLAFAILHHHLDTSRGIIPDVRNYRELLEARHEIPAKFQNHYGCFDKTVEILARWGISIDNSTWNQPAVICHPADKPQLEHFLAAFKNEMPEIQVPKVIGDERSERSTKSRFPEPVLPRALRNFEELSACTEATTAGLFALKAIVRTNLPGAQDELRHFAKFFKQASSIDELKMRAYQGQAIRKELKSDGNPIDQVFVDTSGNIIAPIDLHSKIRDYLNYFSEARALEEQKKGLYRFPPGPTISPAAEHPEVIDSYGVTIGDYIFHNIEHMYALGKRTPASLMAYWRYTGKLEIPHSGDDFERLCKAAEGAMPRTKNYQETAEVEARKKRATLLKHFGIEEQDDGSLLVADVSFENTKQIVSQVFGDAVANEKVKKKE